MTRLLHPIGTLTLYASLAACAGYTPKPLPNQVAWNDQMRLRVDPHHIALTALSAQHINLNAPLNLQAVAALAVLNDPRLQALRDQVDVARAQAFAAGLLPDPKFSASRDIPQTGNSGATSTAYNLRLQFDLGSLITHGAAVSAVHDHLKKVNLQILWQEWQTAAAAEVDYVALVGLRERSALLRKQLAAALQRLRLDQSAQAAGIEPSATANIDLIEEQALQGLLATDARQHATVLASLDALLGLRPGTPLNLAGLPHFHPSAVLKAHAALERLGAIRPDLMALRAGYMSQEQQVRKAVLSQFPSVGIGISRARDTSDVNTVGFGISFSLPLLNGSRGDIAVQKATRQALYDDYVVRLQAASADVVQLVGDIRLLRRQRVTLQSALPALWAASEAADASLRRGNLTLPQSQAQRRAWLNQRMALQDNAQQITELTVALQLLTGSGVFDPVTRNEQVIAGNTR